MQRLRLEELGPPSGRDSVTLGNFDGVHRGHQRLIEVVVSLARSSAGLAVVGTFDPHPLTVLDRGRVPLPLMSSEQKAETLSALGVDRLVTLPFDRRLAEMQAETFARAVLLGKLGAGRVVIGTGFRFGAGRQGDAELLRQVGLEVVEVAAEMADGAPISSTRVRAAVVGGDVEGARVLLGRPFASDGPVVGGERRGRELGFPTANVQPENETLPADGVYAARCRIQEPAGWGVPRAAVVNVGRRPTFGGGERRLEAHLLDFDDQIYGRRLRIEYQARLRDERPFDGVGALVEQLRRDVAQARRVLENA